MSNLIKEHNELEFPTNQKESVGLNWNLNIDT